MILRRRSNPLLGTLVEISANYESTDKIDFIIDKTFNEIKRLEELLSPVNFESEPSKFSRLNIGEKLEISNEFANILNTANFIQIHSAGAFTISTSINDRINSSVEFINDNCIKKITNSAIDLGGIAKGFIVDRAVEYLLENGIKSGVVNAGGDLRVFGDFSHKISIRNPNFEQHTFLERTFLNLELTNRAIATSAHTFAVGHLRSDFDSSSSVSVIAPSCMVADALTKTVYSVSWEKFKEKFSAEGIVWRKEENPERL